MPRHRLFFFILLAALGLIRLLYLLRSPLDLVADEAYYWEWSRHLDWSYFSKGPMVAWIIALSTRLGGHTEFFVRLPAVVLSFIALAAAYELTRRLFDSEKRAFWTAAAFAGTPLLSVGSILMTIDNPLFCFWMLAMLACFEAARTNRMRWWLALGVFIGLGLATKAAMAFFIPSMLLYLALKPDGPRRLREAGPWIAIGLAILFFVPQLVWNARHGFVMFKDFASKGGAENPFKFNPLYTLRFIAYQLAVISPIMFGIAVWGSWKAVGTGLRERSDPALYLASMLLPVAAFYLLLSLHAKLHANWMAVGYGGALIAGANAWMDLGDRLAGQPGGSADAPSEAERARKRIRWRRWSAAGLALGFALGAVLFIPNPLYLTPWKDAAAQSDWQRRLYGWRQLGQRVDQLRAEMPAGVPVMLAAKKYQIAAQLSFYTQGQETAWVLASGPYENQYYFLNNFESAIGRNGIYVAENEEDGDRAEEAFERTEFAGRLVAIREGAAVKTFYLWKCWNFLGWPY
ncbi:MAG: Undecaprenyl phosphate-alpha-4-amino-4-deoxy-L-arabinose arabinosyl transferase [candidate division BRC1 bacterium ADurb.BinA364]|nr:MAG: Undecaprenyl phosphate-alpha-4-amino-4-deoxy-L-arabinose arabinosyl transferase [candidate division BRC1 bacterium ADurb.BinA364]